MTKVKALKNEGLKHEFSVTLPKADVDAQKELRLVEIGKKGEDAGLPPGQSALEA